MSSTPGIAGSLRLSRFRAGIPLPGADFMARFRQRLADPRFWVIQVMVLAVTAGHAGGELLEHPLGFDLGSAYFIPASLYLFPVLYASLNFGKEGAIPTAIWSALLAVPNVFLWHEGLERAGEAFQMSIMVLIAALVATRVDRETLARRRAEDIEYQRRISELKYRALFDAAGEACLVLDRHGEIQDANEAAVDLLGEPADRLKGMTITNWLDLSARQVIDLAHNRSEPPGELRLARATGAETWIAPICTSVAGDEEGDLLLQVLLQDVTERRELAYYAQGIVRALEEERQRIAQEIHDVSVQSLVLLCRQLDAVSTAHHEQLPSSVTNLLAEARRSAEGIGDELRRFSRDLRPLVLDDLGLTPAVRRLVTELSQRSTIRGQFATSGEPRRLSSQQELALFRVAQEALRNTEQHSNATQVTVHLTFAADEVRLAVTDNGSGFEHSPQRSAGGTLQLGLLGMQERARFAGGECEIESSPGRGTQVTARIPDRKHAPQVTQPGRSD